MRVNIGHILFPCALPEYKAADGKRFRHEERTPGSGSACALPLPSIEACVANALRDALHGCTVDTALFVDVRVQEGAAASFCFVRGVLSSYSRTAAGAVAELPPGVTPDDVAAASTLPRVTQLLVALPGAEACCLAVYWEECTVALAQAEPRAPVDVSAVTGGAECVLSPACAAAYSTGHVAQTRLLVVGAGGIGCELLKVLVLYGFGDIDVFDLDTIDATNLNRQFLFEKDDVGAPKSVTARRAILAWFTPSCPREPPIIRAYHANIKDEVYDEAFFRQYSVVLNALDNVSARQHVNRMCMRVGVPLIESGTMGYNGQVQPIVRGRYECYDCRQKSAEQQTVAVCTIHARPTTMVHCVHYAKELYERLFGDGQRGGEDEFSFVDALVAGRVDECGSDGERVSLYQDMAGVLGRCLFQDKIAELLSMKSLWSTRPPVPLDGGIVERAVCALRSCRANVSRESALTLDEALALFVDAFVRCAQRCARVAFQKENDDAVDFVAAVSSVRAIIFHISPPQSVEEIRSIAGAIVPAIATTNAIVAAAMVQQALCVLRLVAVPDAVAVPSMVYVRKAPQVRRRRLEDGGCGAASCVAGGGVSTSHGRRWVSDLFLVHGTAPNPPSLACVVCRDCRPTVHVRLDARRMTFGGFVQCVLHDRLSMSEPSVFRGATVLYEEGEYDALNSAVLATLMSADMRPLELVVDDLDHEVEWRVLVHHCEAPQDDVVVDGLEEALQRERALGTGACALEQPNDAPVALDDAAKGPLLSGGGPAVKTDWSAGPVVTLNSDDSDSDEVVEID
ncbi:putative ubiquitin-activating enzyme E1 [Trypanosoma vivax]|nr:putative ubiquitin-activating enzyme E1 [Trypanosoma vivax]